MRASRPKVQHGVGKRELAERCGKAAKGRCPKQRSPPHTFCMSYSTVKSMSMSMSSSSFPHSQTNPQFKAAAVLTQQYQSQRQAARAPAPAQLRQNRAPHLLQHRLEDLLHAYLAPARIDLSSYSVTFTPRRVGQLGLVGPSRRTIVEGREPGRRARDESLGVAAKHLGKRSTDGCR